MNKDCTLSNIFATARIYALLSIVSAHLIYEETFSYVILSRFGTIGVIVFLIMAGYFFRPEKFVSFGAFLKKKVVTLCVPWLFLGSLTWLYKATLTPNYLTILQYLKWIFGNGSYLYYMPMLLFCFVVMYKAPKWCRFLVVGLNVLSVLLTAVGLVTPILEILNINSYLNFFNWIGFFAFGMLLQDVKEEKIVGFLLKSRFWFVGVFVCVFALIITFNHIPADYFSFIAIPYEMIGAFAIFGLSTFSLVKYSVFKQLSNYSFTIYLSHMILVGLLDGIMGSFAITRLLSPMVIIIILHILLCLSVCLAKKLNIYKFFSTIIGVRE